MKGVTRPLEHSVVGRVRRSKADASGEAVSWCVAVALNMGPAIMGVKEEEMTSHQIFRKPVTVAGITPQRYCDFYPIYFFSIQTHPSSSSIH